VSEAAEFETPPMHPGGVTSVAESRRHLAEIPGGAEHVRRLVDAAPPLSVGQKARLAELLSD
jgi:hypothetical protein